MENTVKAQREQILCDWRNHLSLDEFRLLVVQIDSLIELAREEGGLTRRTLDGVVCAACGRDVYNKVGNLLICAYCGSPRK